MSEHVIHQFDIDFYRITGCKKCGGEWPCRAVLQEQLAAAQAEIAARDERIADLEHQRGDLVVKSAIDAQDAQGDCEYIEQLVIERDTARARVRELEAALRTFGSHRVDCVINDTRIAGSPIPCSCGLQAILASATPEPAPDVEIRERNNSTGDEPVQAVGVYLPVNERSVPVGRTGLPDHQPDVRALERAESEG